MSTIENDTMTDAEFHAWVDRVTSKLPKQTKAEEDAEIKKQAGI